MPTSPERKLIESRYRLKLRTVVQHKNWVVEELNSYEARIGDLYNYTNFEQYNKYGPADEQEEKDFDTLTYKEQHIERMKSLQEEYLEKYQDFLDKDKKFDDLQEIIADDDERNPKREGFDMVSTGKAYPDYIIKRNNYEEARLDLIERYKEMKQIEKDFDKNLQEYLENKAEERANKKVLDQQNLEKHEKEVKEYIKERDKKDSEEIIQANGYQPKQKEEDVIEVPKTDEEKYQEFLEKYEEGIKPEAQNSFNAAFNEFFNSKINENQRQELQEHQTKFSNDYLQIRENIYAQRDIADTNTMRNAGDDVTNELAMPNGVNVNNLKTRIAIEETAFNNLSLAHEWRGSGGVEDSASLHASSFGSLVKYSNELAKRHRNASKPTFISRWFNTKYYQAYKKEEQLLNNCKNIFSKKPYQNPTFFNKITAPATCNQPITDEDLLKEFKRCSATKTMRSDEKNIDKYDIEKTCMKEKFKVLESAIQGKDPLEPIHIKEQAAQERLRQEELNNQRQAQQQQLQQEAPQENEEVLEGDDEYLESLDKEVSEEDFDEYYFEKKGLSEADYTGKVVEHNEESREPIEVNEVKNPPQGMNIDNVNNQQSLERQVEQQEQQQELNEKVPE